ncbi:MAG: GAF domain-containing protein, partial [Pseudolabrys sp.]
MFSTMLAKATELCDASYGTLWLHEGDGYRAVAMHGDLPPVWIEQWRSGAIYHPGPDRPMVRAAEGREPIQIADMRTDPSYLQGDALPVAGVEIAGIRTLLLVPMFRESENVGLIAIYRKEVLPFTDKQIELLKNFAAQAVIAIENTRLLNELRQRTDDLSESLEQQTATSEVLKVIANSSGELQQVFDTMLANATRICAAKFGELWLREGDAFRLGALLGAPPAFAEARWREPVVHPGPHTGLGRIAVTKQPIHITDVRADQAYAERDPMRVILVELAGARAYVAVPMLKEGELIGTIAIYRQEVRPFTDKQIELVKNFAAQAVIAIENTRLLNELRESLQQQTATADVLRVISSSPGELEPVFQAMLANATRLCEASYGGMWLCEGDAFRAAGHYGNLPSEFVERWRRGTLFQPIPNLPMVRAIKTRRPFQVDDLRTSDAYREGYPMAVAGADVAGIRTMVAVPMFKENEPVGVISIYRKEVRPFAEKHIELVTNFASQAVIAIENARLLNELRESLQQQTATADVLKVISRSTFDLQTVLQTLVESAARLCDADKTIITRQKNGVFYRAEAYGFSPEFMDYVRNIPIQPERGSGFGRALLEGRAVHIPDVKADPEYTLVEGQRLGDYRTVLTVPMLREGVPTGVLSLTRSEVRPFTERQIELATTFADQAAIAIENVRLFESVETRTRELAASLEDLRTTQDRLVQTQKLASLGQLTAGIAHEIKNPLNFVNNFSVVSAELIDELQDILKRVSVDDK